VHQRTRSPVASWKRGEVVLGAVEKTSVNPKRLVNLPTQANGGLRVTPGHKILAPTPRKGGPPALFNATRRLLANLGAA
jgi:hypothetical protein